ncbi:MAG: T9SS type A sorting domain-containing protein [Candidatus Zixiibacteriota bacterium]|nr:MAG: T9SS type A sorting domain-containing protein [candidate division Zixibacteria bacterium]
MKNIFVICIAVLFMNGAVLATDASLSYDNTKTPTAFAPNVPDPNVILQGGDNINDATVISALPYNTTGTTAGYINDYDEACPYQGSTAPDVVYSYAPVDDITVDISLCGNSQYDTKIYVYENTVGNLVECIDDNCPGYKSEILGLELTSGNTYYIVVDGYGTEFGDYTFDMIEVQPPPPPPNCDESLYGQLVHGPTDPWSAATSDVGTPGSYLVYDNFFSGGLIGGIKFWGLDMMFNNGWFECSEASMTFEINFYEDLNGQPGTMMESYIVTCPTLPTGIMYNNDFELNEYYAVIDPPFVMNNGWVSIQGLSDPQNCWFLWMSGTGGDGRRYQWLGNQLELQFYDQGYCLYTEATSSVDETSDLLPTEIDMLTSYPNPFNAKTTIAFSLKNAGEVKIAIHDLLGRLVDEIDAGYLSNTTVHSISYDANRLATGVYYYSLTVDGAKKATKKFSLLK